ncbi:divalent-cation tolerance protein CutA [Streptomyces mobaraensis]|uniref:Divalent-cation tolerance protein CutA n=1 Tax=Streptomyces mobaraensis TaxID=35621 RepID=A0A5N5WFU2_STRMB|nr:divalent-cation tolerance protein CutA [Streptomyces mobaraensis]KAB7851268.1 divalent-cation tolerance protein CutA [Streptomyces mobaraensis]
MDDAATPPYLAVLTTAPDEETARRLAKDAVERRLAACAQVDGPVTSVYRWQGAIETDAEWRVLYKTTGARYAELEAHIRAGHPYDVPEVIATPITAGSDAYLTWLRAETGAS